MKKLLSLLLVAIMLTSLFTACKSDDDAGTATTKESGTTETKKEDSKDSDSEAKAEAPKRETLRIMMFGEKPLHFEEVLEEFYARTADTLNVELDIEFNPVPDHKQKLLLIASAGEEYDLVFDAPWMQIKTLSKDGAYIPLDDYFHNDDYPGLKANFSEDYLNSNKFHGSIYGMPITKTVKSAEGIGIRTDMMEKYGYDEIKDYETLQAFFDDILANEPDMVPMAAEGRVGFFRALQPEFERYGIFPAGDFLVTLSEDGKTVEGAVHKFGSVMYSGDGEEHMATFPAPWNTQAAWLERPLQYQEWSKYLEEDVMAQTDPNGFFTSGKAAALSRGYQNVNELATLNKNLGIDTDFYAFPYMDVDRNQIEGETYTDYKVWNFVCIPVTSTKADRTMAFIDWIFQSEENHDLFELGIEGVHWNKVGDNSYEVHPDLAEPYKFPWYQLTGTPNMNRLNSALPETAAEFVAWQSNPDKYTLTPMAGFEFDYDPVKTEKASIDAIYTAITTGIVNGAYEDPAAILFEANENAVKAGLEAMREETMKQVQAFLDSKN